ncbi:hypothetical protein AAVH_15457, partial [Aphelenchoides avenae]
VILTNHADIVFMSNSFFSRVNTELDFFGVFLASSSCYMSTIILPVLYVYRYVSLH